MALGAALETSLRRVPAVLLTALVLRVASSIPLVSPDGTYYLDTARQLAAGRGPVTYALHLGMPAVPSPAGFWPTLYPNVLRWVMAAGVPADRAPALVNAASLLALCLLLVRIGRRCAPPGWAWPVALLGVAHPFYADVLVFAWTEALFMAFVYAALAVLLDVERRASAAPARCALAGLLAGAAFATRFAGVFLLGYLLVALGLIAWRGRWKPAGAALSAAALIGAFALLAVPSVLPNVRAYGSAFGMPRLPEPSMGRAALARGYEIAVTGGKLWLEAAVLVALALLVSRARPAAGDPRHDEPPPDGAGAWLLGGWIAFYVCALFVSLVPYVRGDPLNGRFLAPIVPATVALLARWLARPSARAPAVAAAVAALLALGTFVLAGSRYAGGGGGADPLVEWASDRARESSVVVGTGLWHLRRQTGAIVLTDGYPEMPRLEPARVARFLGEQGARFRTAHLVFAEAGTMRPSARPAYERALAGTGFRLGRVDVLGSGMSIVTLER